MGLCFKIEAFCHFKHTKHTVFWFLLLKCKMFLLFLNEIFLVRQKKAI